MYLCLEELKKLYRLNVCGAVVISEFHFIIIVVRKMYLTGSIDATSQVQFYF